MIISYERLRKDKLLTLHPDDAGAFGGRGATCQYLWGLISTPSIDSSK